MSAASEGAAPVGCGAVLQIQFLVNEGALVTATSDDSLHLWNFKQKAPQIAQTLKFTKERITCMYLPLQSKWLYVGSERGNVHFVNIDSFTLSGYIINWNKAIEVSRKTHPGSIVHLSDNPQDPSKILIGFETGQIVLWDLRLKMAEWRWQSSEPLWSCAWHFEGKQFMCSHADGSLTTWMLRQPKPINVSFPHAKTTKDGKLEPCKAIQKVDWKSSRTGEAYVIFSGGMAYDKAGRTPSITVMHSKTTTVLEMEHTVVDFITLCESPYTSDQQEPYAIVVLLHNDLVVIDLQTAGFPCIENPYPMDIHEAAVTCCSYLADCPADLVPAFYSVGAHNRAGFSKREWPISGGEWPPQSCGYSEIIITGHADGSVKFWDGSAGTLQILYKLKTAKTFEKSRSQSIDGDNEDPFAIQIISLCPESRKLCIAGAAGYVILFTFKRNEESSETTVLEIPIVYEIPEEGDCSPDCEYPPAPSLVSGVKSDNSDNEEKKGNSSVRVKSGVVKKPPGFQAQLVCITPWNQGQPPSQITALAINSSYGLMAYGNEAGIVIVDIVQKVCLLNMGTPDLYGAQDPYSRAPRSPKRGINSGDALGFGEPPQPQARSPSIDQANKLRLQTTPNEVPTPCPSSPCPPSDTTPLEQSEEAIEDISELPSAIPEEPAQTFQQTRRKSILKNFSLKRQLSKVDMKLKSTFAPPERDKETKRSSSTFYCPNIETSECDVSEISKTETVSQIPSLSPIETSDECSTSETVECDAVEELPADIISSDDNNGGTSSQMDSVFKRVENIPSASDNQITKVSRPDVLELVDEEGKPVPPPRQKFRRSIDKRPIDHRDQRLLSVPNIKFSRQQLQGADVKDLRRERDPTVVGQPQGQTFAGHLMRRLNKLDNSFSRSRSSSMSSLDNVSSESIQCLVFADSYTKKSDPTMSVATLWVGTSLGSVLTVLLVPPDPESRSSQPVFVSPCGGPMFRLKGAILVISFLDCSGALIPNSFESWRDENKDKKDKTPTKTNNKMSPTLSESRPSSVEGCGDRQFVVIASVSQARVVALPSQTCIYRNQICEADFIVKADIVTMKDSVCLACYVSSGRMLIFSLPSLRPLLDVDFLPLADLSFQTHCKQGIVDPMLSIWGQQLIVNEDADQIARTFCFSNRGHGLFLSSPSEIQKFTLCTEFCVGLNEMMGELFLPKMEMPEAPKESFIRSWFGGGSRNLDREELFGEASGKPSKSLAKHIPGSGANIQELGQRATTASNEVSRAHKLMVERGEKLGEVEERTQQMMNEAETFQSTAHSVMLKYKDKKWYQL